MNFNLNNLTKELSRLQDMEKSLFVQLDKSVAMNSGKQMQEDIIKQINDLSSIRVEIFEQLNNGYSSMKENVAESKVDLVDQMTINGVVETELNNLKGRYNNLAKTKNEKMRMVEINSYYSERYRLQSDLMKRIIIVFVPILILVILSKKNLLYPNMVNIMIGIILVLGGIYIGIKVLDLYKRDNMNINQYDWKWSKQHDTGPTVIEYDLGKKKSSLSPSSLKDEITEFSKGLNIGCIDEECCEKGSSYNKKTNKCS